MFTWIKRCPQKRVALSIFAVLIGIMPYFIFNTQFVVASSKSNNSNILGIVQKYDDVRSFKSNNSNTKDISGMDLSNADDIIPTLWFNEKTKWPPPSKMPKNCNPKSLIKAAMNPGLGIRKLHEQGITGKGVNVAIIDQPVYLDHPEFKGKIVKYKDFNCNSEFSMHGPAVTSLLVGNNIGTAPGAKVYFAAFPSWLADAKYCASALDWIISENKKLPKNNKIRVVSISAAPSGPGSPFLKNNALWDKSVATAEKEGILVLDCSENHGFIKPCIYDINDPENPAKCIPGFPGMPWNIKQINTFYVPTSPRTTAEEYEKGDYSYQYTGSGGSSWSIPYCAGVLALGWQVNPSLTSKEAVDILLKTAYKKDEYTKIINPQAFLHYIMTDKK